MNKNTREIYRRERGEGVKAKHSYYNFIKPFVEEKRLVLFEAFQEESITNVDGLLEIKRQLMAINALEVEIKTKIDTGKMAAKSLADDQEITE